MSNRENKRERIEKLEELRENARVRIASRMSTKITYLVLVAVIIPIALVVFVSLKSTTSTLLDIYMSYAMNLAEEAVCGIDFAVDLGESTYGNYAMDMAEDLTSSLDVVAEYSDSIGVSDYEKLLGNVNIQGVEGSYAYMVDKDGIMLYHPSAEKIGNSVENAAVKGIVADLAAGKKVDDGYVLYEYKGATKLAGYAFTSTGNIVIVTADYDKFMRIDYDSLIGKIEIKGVEGSYAYMVSPDGTMLYHQNAEKIGKPVENAAIKNIVSELKAGKKVEDDAVVYEYKGEDKIAGYAFTKKGNIVVVTADYKTFIRPITKQRNDMIIVGIAMVVVLGALGIIFVTKMMKALENIIPSIKATAAFNFKYNEKNEALCRRKDEIGVIAREIKAMQLNLSNIVGDIKKATVNIGGNVVNLDEISARVNGMCSDNSETSEDLAAGMEETSASTTLILENIAEMKSGANEIEDMTVDGAAQADEIKERATQLRQSTAKATENTMKIYTSVREKSKVAIEASNAVNKINELTGAVMEISSQTGLLALNASIEAARAGESGRGFAVVADEISNLSVQTTTAVTDINNIVSEVNVAVKNMTECLKEIIDFLESTVINDYNSFSSVSEQYQKDADSFKHSMDDVKAGIVNLNDTLNVIIESVETISTTMNDAAMGVSDIAGKTHNMVSETQNTKNSVDECRNCVADLNAVVEKFIIE